MSSKITGLASYLAILCLVCPASAQDDVAVQIHGFGGWAFGDTDGNSYTVGSSDGSHDNAEFGLNVTAAPHENLRLVGQVVFSQDRFDEDVQVDFDYAFAEWGFSDSLNLRIGRVKHPFGIYTEIFDIGTLRPFFLLPQGIYGPQAFTAKFYNGVGLSGTASGSSAWELAYDVYGGEIKGDFTVSSFFSSDPQRVVTGDPLDVGFELSDVLGGRVNLSTPILGLSLGGSFFFGDETVEKAVALNPFLPDIVDRDAFGLHVQYLADQWSLRSEFASFESQFQVNSDAAYIELARKLNDHWQLAARWDWQETEPIGIDTSGLPPLFGQILKHRDVGIGVSYWLTPDFVLRLNYHMVDDNRYAFPTDPDGVLSVLAGGQLNRRTDLLLFGAQFSF